MFHGSMVALVTPMQANGEIDFTCLADLVDLHINAGTHAIVVAGTTGEAATLTHEEKLELFRHVVKHAGDRISVIAGTHANRTEKVIELSEQAMEIGVDACLIMTPSYIRPTQEGLYKHYKTIADSVPIPMILYNVPSRTACDILPTTIARLSKLPNIIGVKEATGSLNRLLEILDLCGDSLDLYSGDDISAKDFMLLGGKGVISVTANIAPQALAELSEAALAGDRECASAIHHRLLPLHQALFLESNPIPLKWAMNHLNLIPEGIRLPLTQLSEEYHDTLRSALTRADVVPPNS